MSEASAIEWCDATWQVLSGCSPVTEACRNCYSARLCGTRLKHRPQTRGLVRQPADGRFVFNGVVRLNEDQLDWPVEWKGSPVAKREGRPSRIFVADRSDIGYAAVKDEWRDMIFARQSMSPHTLINLTKRPDNLARYLLSRTRPRSGRHGSFEVVELRYSRSRLLSFRTDGIGGTKWPLPNAWVGWSAHDQKSFDEGWAAMKPLAEAGWLVWCSLEPMLGPVDVSRALAEGLGWIVVGGESGHKARPMQSAWVEAVEAACRMVGVAFFFKQWGEWHPCETNALGDFLTFAANDHLVAVPDNRKFAVVEDPARKGHGWVRLGKKLSGSRLNGQVYQAWPAKRRAA